MQFGYAKLRRAPTQRVGSRSASRMQFAFGPCAVAGLWLELPQDQARRGAHELAGAEVSDAGDEQGADDRAGDP